MTDNRNCPKCGKWGQVVETGAQTIYIECSSCGHQWRAFQGTCPHCGKMNKYAMDGGCVECYKARYDFKKPKVSGRG